MTRHSILVPLLVAAIAGAAAPWAQAADDFTPRPQRVFTEKPRIEDYSDYGAFLVDIMEYRRQKEERAAAKRAAATAAGTEPATDSELASVNGPLGVSDSDLYEIRGPESLDDALARARKLPHPVYDEPERFGRTTSQSFPIPEMEGHDMSAREIEGNLHDLESVAPDPYRDESASDKAEDTLATNPGNDDETRDRQASEGTSDLYKASFDPSTRYLTDTNGKRIWVPIFVENEIGFTVIKVLDIEVKSVNN